MIFSHNWIKKYFDNELPNPQELADLLMTHSFEIEGVSEIKLSNGKIDTVIDADVLPNRAHDCLSHCGMAKEIATLTGSQMNADFTQIDADVFTGDAKPFDVEVEDTNACRRYISVVVDGVKVGPSPDWLKENLEAIGQKSINNVVDATNYVMFNLGQPLHSFDKDKLEGNKIFIRWAKAGEKITTLDNKQVELGENNLIIADEKSPLAIAGVKGGKKGEVDSNTKNLVLEAANFKPIVVRKTSRGFAILTDSSKRFENEISPELAEMGMRELVALIKEIASTNDTKISTKTDIYPRKPNLYKVGFTTKDVNKILGLDISENEVEDILKRLKFEYKKVKPVEQVLEMAQTLVGKPYQSGASVVYDAPNKFDCSSFTAYLFSQAGVAIPRISVDQYVFGKPVSKEDLQAGDLVFSNTGLVIKTGIYKETVEFLPGTKVPEGVDHVGLYLDDNKIMHTSSKTGEVVIEDLNTAEMFKNIVGYRRMTSNEDVIVVTVPFVRLDLRIKQDLVEEIGRIYGLKNIHPVRVQKPETSEDFNGVNPLDVQKPETSEDSNGVNKTFYYISKIRKVLTDLGFNEIYTYSLVDKGNVELENPLASNRNFMRTNLFPSMVERLEFNAKNAPLLGLEEVKLFEIGKVFPSVDGEYSALSIGVQSTKGKKQKAKVEKEILEEAIIKMYEGLGIKTDRIDGLEANDSIPNHAFEVNLDELIEKLPDVENYNDVLKNDDRQIKFEKISPYPFMLRDIAVWVPTGIGENDVLSLIKENGGELLVRTSLFDVFEKTFEDGIKMISYAFNLVFQSQERTLTDDEVGEIMIGIEGKMKGKGWEVR